MPKQSQIGKVIAELQAEVAQHELEIVTIRKTIALLRTAAPSKKLSKPRVVEDRSA